MRDCLDGVFSATAGKGVCRQPWWAPKNRARIVGRCTACRWALIHCRALQFIIPVLVSWHHCAFPLFLRKLLAPNGNLPEPSFLAYLLFLFCAQLSSPYNYSVVKKCVFLKNQRSLLDCTKRGALVVYKN